MTQGELRFSFFAFFTTPIMKTKTKGDVGMGKISVLDRIELIREAAVEAENFKLARELGEIQLEIIDERSREWAKGYDAGNGLALREMQVRRLKGKTKVSSINR